MTPETFGKITLYNGDCMEYYEAAKKRLIEHQRQLTLFLLMNNYYIVQISDYTKESAIFKSVFKPNIKPLFLLVGDEDVLIFDNTLNAMQLKKRR